MTNSSLISSYVKYDPEAVYSCKWKNCHSTYDTQPELFRHLEKEHIGRKSNNNLCLACHWDGCTKKYLKRDHITSHIKVHLPFKPHNCQICQKPFKRIQDLKKHVTRIHLSTPPSLKSPSPYTQHYNYISNPYSQSGSSRETTSPPEYKYLPVSFISPQATPSPTYITSPISPPSQSRISQYYFEPSTYTC